MKKKAEEIKKDPLLDAIQEINQSNPVLTGVVNTQTSSGIVDVITFCNDPQYLDLPSSNFNLWLPQIVILKAFYMGTRGNENLKLTQEEWEWLHKNETDEERDGMVYEKNIKDVIVKLLKKEKTPFGFTELHLCVGRRGSKSIMASVISAYEAYKLLIIGNGDPHKFYGIPRGEDIHIINVALSQDQAGILFSMIRQRIMDAPFFRNKISNATTTEIRLLTNEDIRKRKKNPILEIKGSVVILCGHSNPDTLRGKSAVLILFDELAFYDETGKTPGSAFYNALEPSTKKFKQFGDARLVEISSPNTMVGIFYDIYKNAKIYDHILSFQLPTWCVNNDVTYESLETDRKRNPENFAVEYGAQWAKSGTYGNYFEEGLIQKCIRTDISAHNRPMPGFNYYLHVDPANGGDRYAALLVAKEYYANHLGKKRIRIRVANMWIWNPEPGIGLQFNLIDKEMIRICSIFRPLCVTYDQFNSIQSLQLLRSHGINTMCTSFNRGFKQKIYQNLKDMMNYYPQPELWLYDDPRLILEMKALKFRPTQRGMSLIKDKHGETKTDDLCVHPDTIVFTKLRPVEIKDVNIGDTILTTDGTYQKIINKLEHNNFKEIFSIQPYYGETLIATNNHPIETLNNGQRVWKRCDNITSDDFILKSFDTTICDTNFDMVKYIDVFAVKHHNINDYMNDCQIRKKNPNAKWHNRKISLNGDFGYIIGMYISEGSLGNHGITFAGNSNEKEILNKLLKNIKSVFGINGKWFYQGNGCQLNLNSQILKEFFIDLFNHKIAINKYIPSSFMTSNYDFQKSMIRGMFDGDGCYDEKGGRIIFTTTSKYLAHQIQQLLLRFPIISSFTCSKRKGREVIICGRKSHHNRDLYNIQVTDSKSFNILSDILNLGVRKKQSPFHSSKYIWGEGFVACKIRKIRKGICTTVVNLTVENNHTYVSGSINSHNCDCLAGAVASAAETLRAALPPPVTVNMGFR
jgi:hypothetical protein